MLPTRYLLGLFAAAVLSPLLPSVAMLFLVEEGSEERGGKWGGKPVRSVVTRLLHLRVCRLPLDSEKRLRCTYENTVWRVRFRCVSIDKVVRPTAETKYPNS